MEEVNKRLDKPNQALSYHDSVNITEAQSQYQRIINDVQINGSKRSKRGNGIYKHYELKKNEK